MIDQDERTSGIISTTLTSTQTKERAIDDHFRGDDELMMLTGEWKLRYGSYVVHKEPTRPREEDNRGKYLLVPLGMVRTKEVRGYAASTRCPGFRMVTFRHQNRFVLTLAHCS